jgi:hypothetical protein
VQMRPTTDSPPDPRAPATAPRLAELETIIAHGLTTFVEVGQALLEIRESRLYRLSHRTFEAYCKAKWGWNDRRASQLIGASGIVGILPKNLGTLPSSDAVARELQPLGDEPNALAEAWQEAVEQHGPAPTAAEVRRSVRRRTARALERGSPRAIADCDAIARQNATDLRRERGGRAPAPAEQFHRIITDTAVLIGLVEHTHLPQLPSEYPGRTADAACLYWIGVQATRMAQALGYETAPGVAVGIEEAANG